MNFLYICMVTVIALRTDLVLAAGRDIYFYGPLSVWLIEGATLRRLCGQRKQPMSGGSDREGLGGER
jgi:hypothetical protein